MRPPPPPRPPRPDSPSAADREAQRLIEDAWHRHERETRETLRSARRSSVRTLFEIRGRVTLIWALISLALGMGAYILVRAFMGM